MYIWLLWSAQITPLRQCLSQQTVATFKIQHEELAPTSFQKETASNLSHVTGII